MKAEAIVLGSYKNFAEGNLEVEFNLNDDSQKMSQAMKEIN